jgi:hypothetical protein
MSRELERLERDVERELRLLEGLPAAKPRPECVARVVAAVQAEAQRRGARRGAWRLGSVGSAAAAALLLVAGWSAMTAPHAVPEPGGVDTLLSEWASAFDESSSRLTRVVDEGWMPSEYDTDATEELDELFESLDESLDVFQTL